MKLLHKCLAAALLVTGAGSALYADEAKKDNKATKEADPAAVEKAKLDALKSKDAGQSGGQKDKNGKEIWMSVPQIQSSAEQVVAQSDTDVAHVEKLRLAAQKGKDPVELDCVNENLLEMKGERNLLDKKLSLVADAVAVVNEEKGNETIKQATKTGNKIHRLREAADACISSKELLSTGDTQVDWKGPDINNPGSFDVPTEPPGYASPFN
jgi:hypothetical protein